MFRVLLSSRLIGLHLLAVAAVSIAAGLGLWQYDAWQTTREMQAADLANAEPQPLSDVMSADDPYPGDAIGQPVDFDGVWLEEETFVVSGRERNDTDGFWVVTPVAVTTGCADCPAPDETPAMLVVRGWTSTPDSTEPPTGEVAVTGWLQPPEGSGDPDPDRTDDVLPTLRIADAIQRMDQDLYGAYVIAETVSANATGRLEPVTPASLPEPSTFTAVRNLLYALEWWVFGAFAAFIWWRWCRDEIEQPAEVASSP